jgi:hypothetical protein
VRRPMTTAEGKSPREIRRCVKRAIVRQLFKLLQQLDRFDTEVVRVCSTRRRRLHRGGAVSLAIRLVTAGCSAGALHAQPVGVPC